MAEPALATLETAAGEEAATQTVTLTLIEGGATAGEAALGGAAAAEVGGAAVAGEATATGAAALGIGGAAAATAGIALIVIGIAALGYYLYSRSRSDPSPLSCGQPVQPCSPTVQATPAPASAASGAVTSAAAPATAPKPQTVPDTKDVVRLKCKDDWNDCQKRQARAKVRELNKSAKQSNGLRRRPESTPEANRVFRRLKDMWTKRFRRDFDRVSRGEQPRYTKPSGNQDDFMDPCLYEQWKKDGLVDMDVDHLHDTGWSGNIDGPFKFFDHEVNQGLGTQMREGDNLHVEVAQRFELDCN